MGPAAHNTPEGALRAIWSNKGTRDGNRIRTTTVWIPAVRFNGVTLRSTSSEGNKGKQDTLPVSIPDPSDANVVTTISPSDKVDGFPTMTSIDTRSPALMIDPRGINSFTQFVPDPTQASAEGETGRNCRQVVEK